MTYIDRRRNLVGGSLALALVLTLISPTAAPAHTRVPASGDAPLCAGMTLDEARTTILDATNAHRVSQGKAPLQTNPRVDKLAQNWSVKQAAAKKMSHNPKVKTQLPVGWQRWGENVAAGYQVVTVTPAWINSTGHRQNIERTEFTHIGIGVACDSLGYPYYTQVFAGYKKDILALAIPTVSGKAKAGLTLTADPGTWTEGATLSYQWYANGKKISGATKATYKPGKAQIGKKITVKVTGKKSGYNTETKTSSATAKVAKYSKLKTATPKTSGTAKAGITLTAKPGTWTAGTTLTYQWYANGKKISGATSATFTPTKSYIGKRITVKVTGKKAGYSTVTRTSKTTAKVAKYSTFTAATPVISAETGMDEITLTAVPGKWTAGATLSYQWFAGGIAVPDATDPVLVLSPDLHGATITVKVTGKKPGYTTLTKTSKAAVFSLPAEEP